MYRELVVYGMGCGCLDCARWPEIVVSWGVERVVFLLMQKKAYEIMPSVVGSEMCI